LKRTTSKLDDYFTIKLPFGIFYGSENDLAIRFKRKDSNENLKVLKGFEKSFDAYLLMSILPKGNYIYSFYDLHNYRDFINPFNP
jgi:hypothetical protein